MASYKLYDIGTVSDSTYMYKGTYTVDNDLSTVTEYELMVSRFNLSDGSIDANYGQEQQGAYRMQIQIKPSLFALDTSRLCPGIMFDASGNITFAGIAWMGGLSRHGFFIAKLDNTGNLSSYGTDGFGLSVGGFDSNVYSCTKELLIDDSNNTIFGVATREFNGDVSSPSYIARRNSNGELDSTFGNNGKVKIEHSGFIPQIQSLTFDNYGNYYAGYNALKNDGSIFGNSYIKSYNYNGGENTYFSSNGVVIVNAGHTFASEAPQDLGSIVRDQYLDHVKAFLTLNGEDGSTSYTDPIGGQTISFVGNSKISTSEKKFGSSSAKIDGTNNSYLELGNNKNPSDYDLDNNDFCIEGMYYFDGITNGNRLLSLGGNTSTTGLLMEVASSGGVHDLKVQMGTHTNGNSNVVDLLASDCLVISQWHHIAYIRKDNNFTLFVDGKLKASSHYEGAVNLGTTGSLKLGADQNGENVMLGYIDDFRITIGHSRYFSTFEMPKYQISSVGPSTDVKLLLHFEGDNNSKTIVDRGVAKISTASCLGNAEVSSDNYKFGGTSLKLDGVNSVVEVPDSKLNWPTSFYTNPFTIEGHFYFNDVSQTQVLIKKNNSITMQYDNLSGLKFLSVTLTNTNNATTRFKQLPWEPVANRWYHIAFVKNGVNVGIYVDGQRLVDASYLDTVQDGGDSSPWDIGGNRAGSADYFNGYIDEVRITSSAVYTGTFTPAHHEFYPTQEHVITSNDNYASNNKLLLHFEEVEGTNVIDSSDTNATVTLQNGTVNSTNSRFGNKSLSIPLSGTGANIAGLVSNATDIGSGNIDYTIEMYFKLNSLVNNSALLKTVSTTDQSLVVTINTNSGTSINVRYQHGEGVGEHIHSMDAPVSLDTSKWYHLALVRSNNKVKIYIDGVQKSMISEDVGTTINGPFVLGQNLDGYIDEMRITDGIARYTTNFTPQTSAFGSEPVAIPEPQYVTEDYSNSELLLHFDQVSSNALAVPVDSSGKNRSVLSRTINSDLNSGGRSTSISRFGGQSWFFNGGNNEGKYLEVTSTDFNFGSDEFCVDLWYYPTEMVGPLSQKIISNEHGELVSNNTTNGFLLGINSDNKLFCDTSNTIAGSLIMGDDMSAYVNKWNHIAVTRDNTYGVYGILRMFLNGDEVASTVLLETHSVTNNSTMRIGGGAPAGGASSYNDHVRGYLDEVHVRRGVSVYKNNFYPPQYAFGKRLISYVHPTAYYKAKSELKYMLPKTQSSSFLALAKKTNSDNTTYAEILNIKHDGKYLTDWANNGKLALTVPGYNYIAPEALWMDRELNLYVIGSAKKASNNQSDGIVWKVDSDGALDTAFGTNGVDIKNNSALDENITSIYNDYNNNKMIYTSLFTSDSGEFINSPTMAFDSYNFGGDLNFLSSYEYISKQTTPDEGLNRVLQDMGLTNAAHIKMPASMFNDLFKSSFDENTQLFTTNNISLTVDQTANDNITVVSGGLIKDFWNYFVAQIEALLPADKRGLWDDSPDGANGYTNVKLQNFFRDSGLGNLTVSNVNDVIREYETNSVALFPHRVKSDNSIYHRRDGFVAGDKAGITAGVQITFQATISAATGGTAQDTLVSETRTFNVLLELE